MKLSYDATWQDVTGMLRAHSDIILVVTGVFLLLPTLAQAFYFPPPSFTAFSEAAVRSMLDYYAANLVPILAVRLTVLMGTGALLALLVSPGRPTVGEAIRHAMRLLPTLFLADVLTQFLIWGGLFALVLPGLYLVARTAVTAPAIMAEAINNPLRGIGRSLAITQGIGWQVFGLIAIVMIISWIAVSAMSTVFGVLAELALPDSATMVVRMILAAFSPTALSLVYVLLSAGIYRQALAARSGV